MNGLKIQINTVVISNAATGYLLQKTVNSGCYKIKLCNKLAPKGKAVNTI